MRKVLPDVSALDSDFVFSDLEDFVVVSEVAADWSDDEASDFDFLDSCLFVFVSVLWSMVDCCQANPGMPTMPAEGSIPLPEW